MDSENLGDAVAEACELQDGRPQGNCPDGTTCQDGRCRTNVCAPNSSRCLDESTIEICRNDGQGWEQSDCEMGQCREMNGAATCDDVICVAGQRTCNGLQTVVECSDDGTRFNVSNDVTATELDANANAESVLPCAESTKRLRQISAAITGPLTLTMPSSQAVMAFSMQNGAVRDRCFESTPKLHRPSDGGQQ